jgi:hypothetical protein
MYYTTQSLEKPDDTLLMEDSFRTINAETQLLYASDYPSWDFDLPGVIYDLPFLSEKAKRNILGDNARKLFNLDVSGGIRHHHGAGPGGQAARPEGLRQVPYRRRRRAPL